MRLTGVFLSLFLLLNCGKKSTDPEKMVEDEALTYLALGDSYTIGEAVEQQKSFPYQLTEQLKSKGLSIAEPKIIAKTGWTTDELQSAIKAENIKTSFDIVTLLIGVNNQYRGYSQTTYRKEFKELLQTAIGFAGNNKNHVFVISIPDWEVTPFAAQNGWNVATVAQEINAFNTINKEETLALGISYTDISPASRNAATDLELIAADGLHPSGKMYLDWAVNVVPAVVKNFK